MRGAANTVLWIVLGLIVLGIFLFSTVGPMGLKNFANDAMESMFGVKDFFDVEGETTEIVPYPIEFRTLKLSSDKNEALMQLASRTIECYNRGWSFDPGKKTACYLVDVSDAPYISRSELIEVIDRTKPEYFSLGTCIEGLSSGWCVPDVISRFIGDFRIGGGRSLTQFNFPVVTYRYNFTNPNPVQVQLSPDADTAARQLAGMLMRCWAISKEGYDRVCAVFDPSQLSSKVTRQMVLDELRIYGDEDALEQLEDWWEADGDAYMEYEITSASAPFFACASDFSELGDEDLCLTHDRNNNCCT